MKLGIHFAHRAYQYSGLSLALAALSCGQSSSPSGKGGAGAGGSATNTGDGGNGGTDTTTQPTAGSAGALAQGGGTAGSSTAGSANPSGAVSGSAGSAASVGGDSGGSGGSGGGETGGDTGGEAGGDAQAPANDLCQNAKVIPLTAPSIAIVASTVGAQHDIDAPCDSDSGPDVFYEFDVSRRVFVYADTFGANWDTTLYLLTNDCTPLSAPTTFGDAVCNTDACGTPQSQIVALLDAGRYRLGLGGHGAASGTTTIHFQWTLAGGGSTAQLPAGSTVQSGTTTGASGNIQGISADCLSAGPENSYWWSSCPSDPGGALNASTCGGAAWETVLELELPASAPYSCSLDSCNFLASLSSTIPAGAGLRVLSVDGEGGPDKGAYTMNVSRP